MTLLFRLARCRRRLVGSVVVALVLTASMPGYAATKGGEDYRKRIAVLESRVGELERMVEQLSSRSPLAESADLRAGAASSATPGASAKIVSSGVKRARIADSVTASAGPEPQPAISGDDKNAIHQLYVVRDEAITLQPGRWETDFELTYTRDSSFLQSSWALGALASVRYGAAGGWEFGVRVPYDWTHRHTVTITPTGRDVSLAAIGDVSFDVSKLIVHETTKLPGIVVSGSVTLPTGVDPYASGALTPGKDPSDPFHFYRNAGGHYGAEIGAELFKTVDPFAYFGGLKFTYAFPRDVGGESVFPGYSIAYNLGATLALSDSTSMGFAVFGAVKTNMVTGGKEVPGTSTLPLSTTISILQRVSEGFYVEPSVTIGLTNDAANAILALKTTKTF